MSGRVSGRRLRVGLVQINNSFSGQNYLPYSVGLLQSYAIRHARDPERFEFLPPIYKRIRVDAAAEALRDADAVFFSTYVWNERLSLEIARRLKSLSPHVLTVFGGPQVPSRIDPFMEANPFVDVAAHGEGERIFLSVLDRASGEDFREIPSITFRDRSGLVSTPRGERMRDLKDVPSPYLDGVFESLMSAHPEEKWIALWETNRGCPFSCTFCDWGSAVASKVFAFDAERLRREVEWFAEKRIEFVFCADANFGILPRDLDLARHVADVKARRGYPHALSVQNTKNATERAYEVQSVLARAGLNKGVAISLQSTDPGTLKSIKRSNISLGSYAELQRRFTRDGVETYTDMILGLPGETYDSFADGVGTLIEGGQHNRIQFNNLSILPNAEMGDPEYQKRFGMEIVKSDIINIHGSLLEEEEVSEAQELVIGTASMPREEWVRTRAFSWMCALLYFDKVLQIPLTIARECSGLGYHRLLEAFTEGTLEEYPVLEGIRSFFRSEAVKIQNGGAEYVPSKEWLNIWWPADEFALIRLCFDGRIADFYEEAGRLLEGLVGGPPSGPGRRAVREAVRLNSSLLKVPYQREDLAVRTSFNTLEYFRSVVHGAPIALEEVACTVLVDRSSKTWWSWEDWCREVVWYGNKKGAYLYGTAGSVGELAGHF